MTLGRDHHVGRLDVAMDDVPIVRVLNRVENGKAQPDAIDRGEPMLVGIPIDARACHVLHHEVGQAVWRRAAIEERRDVGMFERGENLTLVAESADDQLGIHAAPNHLDGDVPFEHLVGTAGEIDRAHAAAPDARFDEVRPYRAADVRFRRLRVDAVEQRFLEECVCVRFRTQQRFDFGAQHRVAGTELVEQCRPRVGTFLQHSGKDLFHPQPWVARH